MTCPLADTNFILSCSTRYLTSELRCDISRVRYRVEHSKIKFVSTRGHVISSIYTSPGQFNPGQPVSPQRKICACPYYCVLINFASFSHEPAECLHEKIWKVLTLLAGSTRVLKNVTRQEGLTRGGSVFHVNGYRRLTEKDYPLR